MSGPAAAGLDALLADGLAELINRGLALDPASQARIAALEGLRARITATLPEPLGPRDMTIAVLGGRLRLLTREDTPPNVIVRGSPTDLLAWLNGRGDSARLTIDGDGTVLQELSGLLRGYRPELGEPLTALLGADAARTALGSFELALAGLRSAFEGARHSVRDGAAGAFADRETADRLLDDVQDLRLRVDRLGARVAAEEQRGTAP